MQKDLIDTSFLPFTDYWTDKLNKRINRVVADLPIS